MYIFFPFHGLLNIMWRFSPIYYSHADQQTIFEASEITKLIAVVSIFIYIYIYIDAHRFENRLEKW